MLRGLFKSNAEDDKPSPKDVQAFADAAAAGDEEALSRYIGKFGKDTIDLPCPKTGYSALMRAAQHGHTALCAKLIDAGANVNWRDKDGWTPLRMAVNHRRRDTAELFLDRNASVNQANNEKWTPLMKAADEGDEQMALLLLSRGADARLRNNAQQSAADIARAVNRDLSSLYDPIAAALDRAAAIADTAERDAKAAETAAAISKIARAAEQDMRGGLDKAVVVSRALRLKGQT